MTYFDIGFSLYVDYVCRLWVLLDKLIMCKQVFNSRTSGHRSAVQYSSIIWMF